MKDKQLPSILQVDEVLISSDLLTERFCCDLNICKGKCCIEGDAGAPVTLDEVAAIEEALDIVWPDMAASDAMVYLDVAACIKGINGSTHIAVLYDAVVGQLVISRDRLSNDTVIKHCSRVGY